MDTVNTGQKECLMHPYRELVVIARDSGTADPYISLEMRTGDPLGTRCVASKVFPMDQWGEVRDILGWASHAFLNAADQLTEDGWEVRHRADCSESHLAVTDA